MADRAEQRRREHDRLDRRLRPITSGFEAKVVGVAFVPAYPSNLSSLRDAQEAAEASGEPLAVILVRNPDNEFDVNAIQVHVPALGDQDGFIGHLTSPVARRLAPQMDSGERWGASVVEVLIHPDHPDRPGISIRCAPAPQEETNE